MITWSPWRHLREWYPDVRVLEADLPGSLMGFLDREQRIIWLDNELSEVQRTCTLAVEVGVLELGPFSPDTGDGAAADWAAMLLIPFDALLDVCGRTAELQEVAEELGVDTQTLRTRLDGLTAEEASLLPHLAR